MTAGRTTRWLPVGLVGAVALVYANGLNGPFLFDDKTNIVNNPLVHDLGLAVRAVTSDPRPVTTLTFALNYAAAGETVWPYRATNVAIHALAAVVLFALLARTLAARGTPHAARSAFVAALLWAVHPLQTESVTYVVQRSQALAGLFTLLTLYALSRGAAATRRTPWYVLAVVACGLGMGCKQDAVVTPILALIFDRAFLAGSWRGVARRWPVHAALIATWIVLTPSILLAFGAHPSQVGGDAAADATAGFSIRKSTPVEYLLTQAEVIPHYLRLTVWPDPLCIDYDDWPVAKSVGDVWPAFALTAGLLIASVYALWRWPAVGFLAFAFFLLLAPTSSVLPIEDVAVEHRTYLPLAAVVALAVLAAGRVVVWIARPQLGVALATGAVVLLGWKTVARNAEYGNEVAFWRGAVEARPDNWRAHHNLAVSLVRAGRPADAVEHFDAALLRHPSAVDHALLAQTLVALGREAAAVPHFREAVRLIPQERRPIEPLPPTARLHYNLALALDRQGDWAGARAQYQESARLDPAAAETWINLGRSYSRQGEWAAAADSLAKALAADPASALAHNNRGLVLARLGRADEAVAHWARAVDLRPTSAAAYNSWAALAVRRGDAAAADRVLDRAWKACGPDPRTAYNVAHLRHAQGRHDESREWYRRAVQLDPKWPAVARASAWALATHPAEAVRDPAEAVRLGEQAVQATQGKDAAALDAVAAAYAAAGRFPDAVRSARDALALAPNAGVKARLERYERGEAFLDSSAAP